LQVCALLEILGDVAVKVVWLLGIAIPVVRASLMSAVRDGTISYYNYHHHHHLLLLLLLALHAQPFYFCFFRFKMFTVPSGYLWYFSSFLLF
jgi:hypothetical protein